MTNPLPNVLITKDNIAKCERIVENGFMALWLSEFSNLWTAPAQAFPDKDELIDAVNAAFYALVAVIVLVLMIVFLPILAIYWFIGSAVSYRKIRLWIPIAKKHLDSTGAIASLTTEI
jgi:hypothetical protein